MYKERRPIESPFFFVICNKVIHLLLLKYLPDILLFQYYLFLM